MKYKWLHLNPSFDIYAQTQKLKWGNISAIFRRGEFGGELTFYYGKEFLKTYDTKRPSLEWINACLVKFLDSKMLDIEIREKDDERSFTDITQQYRDLTGSLR